MKKTCFQFQVCHQHRTIWILFFNNHHPKYMYIRPFNITLAFFFSFPILLSFFMLNNLICSIFKSSDVIFNDKCKQQKKKISYHILHFQTFQSCSLSDLSFTKIFIYIITSRIFFDVTEHIL